MEELLLQVGAAACPGAVVIPPKVEVWGVLLDSALGAVAGFDLSAMNTYQWHPHAADVDLRKCVPPQLAVLAGFE